jgi:hypothetical protein
MLEVPAEMPETVPEDEPIAATDGLLLVHVPPASALLSVVANPTQALSVPVIAAGRGLTVTVATA